MRLLQTRLKDSVCARDAHALLVVRPLRFAKNAVKTSPCETLCSAMKTEHLERALERKMIREIAAPCQGSTGRLVGSR